MTRVGIADLEIGNAEHEAAATVALIRSQSVPASKLGALIDELRSAVRAVQFSEDDRLFATPDAAHDLVGCVTDDLIEPALRDVRGWAQAGYDFRIVLDAAYPNELREIFNRPPIVFIRGNWPSGESAPAIAIVGTRQATNDGLARARRLSSELVHAGFTVLSGLAAGIDTAAHTAALDGGGLTRAVMGTGVDRIFPKENGPLAERILDSGGALLSQFFPQQPGATWTFPMRNIVMSGLSTATVVVEAAETSGARMQARVALQHGRTVFLLKSLVASHEWARKYVEEGAYGTRAIEIASTRDITDRLTGLSQLSPLAVA